MSQILILYLQILIIFTLAMLILRPWIKTGILNPKKTKLSALDRFWLTDYEIIVTVITLEGILVVLPLTLLVSIIMPKRREFLHNQGKFWTNIFLWAVCVRVKIEGQENLPAGPVIYVQNLETYLDGAATLAKLPASYRMIFKRHLMEVPLLGWLERMLGYLALEEEEISLMHEDVLEILKVLSRGESVLTFAEEKLGSLDIHGGIALFALQSKLPLIPISVKRALTSPQVGAFMAKPFPYEITIKVGKPFLPAELIDDRAHRQKLKEQIKGELTRLI